jgi:hypothetical protein
MEANTLPLEEASLARVVPCPRADCALRIHDAVPWKRRTRGQRMKCVTNQARLPWQTGEARNLSVGGYAAARYLRNDIVDSLMQTFGRHTASVQTYSVVAALMQCTGGTATNDYLGQR